MYGSIPIIPRERLTNLTHTQRSHIISTAIEISDSKYDKRMNNDNKTQILKTLMEPTRIQILDHLQKSDACVCEMVQEFDIKHNLLSHHLSTLVDLGFLLNTKKGRHSIYRIDQDRSKCVAKVLELFNSKTSECL